MELRFQPGSFDSQGSGPSSLSGAIDAYVSHWSFQEHLQVQYPGLVVVAETKWTSSFWVVDS